MFTATLSKNAQNALALLGKNKSLPHNTYLAGGSALALHFGHRISVDFDFFTPSDFNEKEIIKKLEKIGTFSLQEKKKNTLLGLFEKTKFSLFRYDYPLLVEPPLFHGVRIANPKDIAAMKIAAIMDRGTKKDFIDLFFLVKKGISIEQALQYYDKKYKAFANNMYSIILSLSYFVQADDSDMPEMIQKVDWKEVKKFFEKESVNLAKKYLS
ncbi:nucleotidyl transferase AbiEii/AbiGii toxin family protein [Candidatus Roizmanbacteria bacterium]|nr:nucleotidyl transferase AbiEii/AbiGii toxin family protein [Candidatus Roizmanbacteria bacterium]